MSIENAEAILRAAYALNSEPGAVTAMLGTAMAINIASKIATTPQNRREAMLEAGAAMVRSHLVAMVASLNGHTHDAESECGKMDAVLREVLAGNIAAKRQERPQ